MYHLQVSDMKNQYSLFYLLYLNTIKHINVVCSQTFCYFSDHLEMLGVRMCTPYRFPYQQVMDTIKNSVKSIKRKHMTYVFVVFVNLLQRSGHFNRYLNTYHFRKGQVKRLDQKFKERKCHFHHQSSTVETLTPWCNVLNATSGV